MYELIVMGETVRNNNHVPMFTNEGESTLCEETLTVRHNDIFLCKFQV